MRACARTDRETTKSLFFRNGQESRCVELHLVYTIDYGPLREIEYLTIEKGVALSHMHSRCYAHQPNRSRAAEKARRSRDRSDDDS